MRRRISKPDENCEGSTPDGRVDFPMRSVISVASGSRLLLDSDGAYGDPRPGHRKAGSEAPARIPKTGLWIADWWTFFFLSFCCRCRRGRCTDNLWQSKSSAGSGRRAGRQVSRQAARQAGKQATDGPVGRSIERPSERTSDLGRYLVHLLDQIQSDSDLPRTCGTMPNLYRRDVRLSLSMPSLR